MPEQKATATDESEVIESALRVLPERGLPSDDPAPDPKNAFDPRGFSLKSFHDPAGFKVVPEGEPQGSGEKFWVIDPASGQRIYAGKTLKYGSRRGLSRSSDALIYDRFAEEGAIGAWAHFLWPTVMAESNGRYISINAWDRAHFTWGFYQLAAHTADDNLILLMRELLKLPLGRKYFPDLHLHDGRVHQMTDRGAVNLEVPVQVPVGTWTETQIPSFMKYLNPSSKRLDNVEVVAAAKFALWALEDPLMRAATVSVSISIMKRKLKWLSSRFDLKGRRPELAIWVSDMYHHGRGSAAQVRTALAKSGFTNQLAALSKIDRTGQHAARLKNVKKRVDVLLAEDRFQNVTLGDATLPI